MDAKTVTFRGTVVRIEPSGFGVVTFDHPLASGNTHGIISTTTITSTNDYLNLAPGVHVTGEARLESDPKKLAPITTIQSSV